MYNFFVYEQNYFQKDIIVIYQFLEMISITWM